MCEGTSIVLRDIEWLEEVYLGLEEEARERKKKEKEKKDSLFP